MNEDLSAGIASTRELLDRGITDRMIAAAVRDGRLRRLRTGWYASPSADVRVASAVAMGGRLACASALSAHGVWVLRHGGIHVSVPDGSHRRSHAGCRVHHRVLRSGPSLGLVESPLEALEQLSHCASPVETVIAMDSALEQRLVTRSQLEAVFDRSRRSRWLLEHCDGRSQSGIETIARLALRRRGIRLRPQVAIAGVGRVDLVIGDRLVLELDGEAWHAPAEAFESDRRRDLALAVVGYLPVRVTYRRVIDDWDGLECQLLTLVRHGQHLWTARLRVMNDAGIGQRGTNEG